MQDNRQALIDILARAKYHIRVASEHQLVQKSGGYIRWIEESVMSRWQVMPNWETKGDVKVEIEQSNFVVFCPNCKNIQLIDPHQPFFCLSCLNEQNGYYSYRTVMPPGWPDGDQWHGIYSALMRRQDPMTRGWRHDETREKLLAENIAHGVF